MLLPSSEGEMEALVVSLSREATDESRRGRVAAVFSEALSPAGAGAPGTGDESGGRGGAAFSALFDRVLIAVGDRVKAEVQEAQERQASSPSPSPSPSATDEQGSSRSYQLWALVDMMVQSKTIVKRARGELGKEGSFG
jgi:hypothetical protein